jgi:outer membrane protein OmpA-like peptidoglycan-associated protein
LTELAALMKSDSTLRVALEGHTDDYGPERFNQVLSLKRAERVRARLEDLGVGPARIDIKGYGSDQPLDTETTAKARARNRRVEITFN